MEQNNSDDTPRFLTEDQRYNEVRKLIIEMLSKNALIKGILLSTGYYNNLIENLPELLDILLSSQRGIKLLQKMGVYDILQGH